MGVLYDFNKYEALNVGRYKVDFIEKWRRGSLVSEICPYHRMNFQGLCNPTPILITEARRGAFWTQFMVSSSFFEDFLNH